MADANAPGMHVNLRTPTGTPAGTAADPIVVTDASAGTAGAPTLVRKAYDWTGAVTAQAVWTPASGKKFVITGARLNCSASCTVTLYDGATDDLTGRVLKGTYAQYGGETMVPGATPLISSTVNNALNITTSAGSGFLTVWGYEV